jgi:type VII secretion-associated serine protease mycosin
MTATVSTMCGTVALPASAAPEPRAEEWWFSTWRITDRMWPYTRGSGVTVAVLDAGVNAAVPDLKGAVLPGTDTSGVNGDGRTDYDDEDNGHGTAMAALIAGRGRGTGMVGVAPEAKILPVSMDHPAGHIGPHQAQAAEIRWAVDHGAKVISMSTGGFSAQGPRHCDIQDAVDYAVRRDVVLVASAGNEGQAGNTPAQPATCPGAVAVGAVDYRFRPWEQTQRQPYVMAAAPGVQVGSVGKDGVFIRNVSGTSLAAALTAGATALIRSKFPTMPARKVVRRLIASARDVGPKGRDNQNGYGLLRPYRALTGQVPAAGPNPVYQAWQTAHRTTPPAATTRPISPIAGTGSHKLSKAGYAAVGLGALAVGAAVNVPVVVRRRRTAAAPAVSVNQAHGAEGWPPTSASPGERWKGAGRG